MGIDNDLTSEILIFGETVFDLNLNQGTSSNYLSEP